MKLRREIIYKKEWWVVFFVLGFFLINYPIIHIFNKDFQIFGYPAFFLYLMFGWFCSIMVIFLYVYLSTEQDKRHRDESRNEVADA